MTQWAYFIPENKMGDREMKFVIICLPAFRRRNCNVLS